MEVIGGDLGDLLYVELERVGDGWWGSRFQAESGSSYGFRLEGAYDPARGLYHNSRKLLFDPYARCFAGRLAYGDVTRIHAPYNFYAPSELESGGSVPLGVIGKRNVTPIRPRRLEPVPWAETVVYELHVKSATARMASVPPELRGTYLGLAHESFVAHLRRLGVTTVELLPVQFFADTETLLKGGLTNYWGYNTVSFFAPEPRYATRYDFDLAQSEFSEMVDALHSAGIEVILDVVYNHTGEGDISGPTFSYRGLSANSYYIMEGEGRLHVDLTGTGNTLNFSSPVVNALVLDSLRYFADRFSIDGFRFDLATTLGRADIPVLGYPFMSDGGVLGAIRNDPVLSGLKLIAEPWDVGPHGYRRSEFRSPYLEWNDRLRDTIRRSFRPDTASAARLEAEVTFSGDPLDAVRSLNFVACHDGFTLEDLVSYVDKHNLENQEGNRDGTDANYSYGWGGDGPAVDEGTRARRNSAKRAMMAALFLAPGVPMIGAGDELGRTQNGNNNAYCQDKLEYCLPLDDYDKDFLDYLAALIALRQSFVSRARSVERLHWGPSSSLAGRDRGNSIASQIATWYFEGGPESSLLVIANVGAEVVLLELERDLGLMRAELVLDSARAEVAGRNEKEDWVTRLDLAGFSVAAFRVDLKSDLSAIV